MPDSLWVAGVAQGDLWGSPILLVLREASLYKCQEAEHPFQMGGGGHLPGFLPHVQLGPIPSSPVVPSIDKKPYIC